VKYWPDDQKFLAHSKTSNVISFIGKTGKWRDVGAEEFNIASPKTIRGHSFKKPENLADKPATENRAIQCKDILSYLASTTPHVSNILITRDRQN
jgi:RPA family protein